MTVHDLRQAKFARFKRRVAEIRQEMHDRLRERQLERQQAESRNTESETSHVKLAFSKPHGDTDIDD